ncbi:EI24 domain-containing protein [Caminibacter pacificus]
MKALVDLFDGKILKYTFLPFILSILFWGVVFYFFSDNIYAFLEGYVSYIPFGESIKNFLATIGSGLVIFIFYYLAVISTLGVFSSFFIDHIVLRINEKHYNLTPKKPTFNDTLKGVLVSIKSFLIYFVIFIFTFFFLFIPVVNILYQLFMWSLLNKKPLVFDSSYLFANPDEIEKKYNSKIWALVFLTSIVYFIPIVSLFGYTFQLVFMTHFVLKKLKEEK